HAPAPLLVLIRSPSLHSWVAPLGLREAHEPIGAALVERRQLPAAPAAVPINPDVCAVALLEVAPERCLGLILKLGGDALCLVVKAVVPDGARALAAIAAGRFFDLFLVAVRDRAVWMNHVGASDHAGLQHLEPPRIERREALFLLDGKRSGADDIARMPITEIALEQVEQHGLIAARSELLVDRAEPSLVLPIGLCDLLHHVAALESAGGYHPIFIAGEHGVQSVRFLDRIAPFGLDLQRGLGNEAFELPLRALITWGVGFVGEQK